MSKFKTKGDDEMGNDIKQDLLEKGFKVVLFKDVKDAKYSSGEIYLSEESEDSILEMLNINPTTAALSGEQEKLFIVGKSKPLAHYFTAGEEPPSIADVTTTLKYEVIEATE